MRDLIHLELSPLNTSLRVPKGTPLRDVLFAQGVEFPCGGQGRCRGCKIKLRAGDLSITAADTLRFSAEELARGWRLACQAQAQTDLSLELAQWEAPVLSDDSPFPFTPEEGLGIAVDIGTTTLVAQLIDLQTGQVLAVQTALNPQAQHGADIMSRVEFAVAGQGQARLEHLIRAQIGAMTRALLETASAPLRTQKLRIVLVGNTVMHHLFCGLDLTPMAAFPFEPRSPGPRAFTPTELGWRLDIDSPISAARSTRRPSASALGSDAIASKQSEDGPPSTTIQFLPCLGSFVGSDLLAGVLATRLHESEALAALIDLGTNGEIVLGNRTGLLCASTAAGPAFEGARIAMGMRAATGAISEVRIQDGQLICHVLGDGTPRGICGSGLVDAVAAALELGWLSPSGRIVGLDSIPLAGPVRLVPRDIRELQLAKGAIAAGLRILLQQWGAKPEHLSKIYLAGAFGNYLNPASAQRIGLLKFPTARIHPAGNTALLGAKLALCDASRSDGAYPEILARTRHVSLNEDTRFLDAFAEEMAF